MAEFADGGQSDYSHKQWAPLCLVLYGSALACFVLAAWVGELAGIYISGGAGVLLCLLATAFQHLKVEDAGDVLAIRFGPVPLFHRSVRYADIEDAEVSRTTLLDGWGIHYSLRGGWVWNIWGFDSVLVRFKDGKLLWIGTDDAEQLAGFLKGRVRDLGA